MGFKDFIKKSIEKYKESQKPENIKKQIEKEKLLAELEEAKERRRKSKYKKMEIGLK